MRTRTGRQVALPVLVLLLATACSDESTSGSLTQVAQDATVNGAEGDAGVSGTIGSDAVAPSLDASTAPEAGSAEDALVNEGDTVVQDGGPLPDAGGDGTINPDAAPAPDAEGGGACGACGSATPFCFGDACVECLNSAHCPPGSTCNEERSCVPEDINPGPDDCEEPTPQWFIDHCVECLNQAHCGEGEFCNASKACEVQNEPMSVEATWHIDTFPDAAVVTLHIINLAMPVEGPDLDGDGGPDPYFTDASCTTGTSPTAWGCEMSMPFGNGHAYGVLEDHPSGSYRVAVHYERHPNDPPEFAEWNFTATTNVRVEVGGEFHVEAEAHFNAQPLEPGDLWCVAVVNTHLATIEPCLDADGEPLVVPNYPAPEE